MTETEKQALAIYEMIAATSKTRPMSFQTVEQMRRETAAWKENNPAFVELGRAEPPVLHAFLAQSFDWLRAEAHLAKDYTTCNTLRRGSRSHCHERRSRCRVNLCRTCSASITGTWARWRTCFFRSGSSSRRSRGIR